MICSLSADDKNYPVYIKLYTYLAAKLNTLMNDQDASINVDDIMKSMYEKVFAKTNDHELALRFARMVPTAMYNIAGKNMQKISVLMDKGFDPTATAKLAAIAINPETGIEYIEKVLGIKSNLLDEIKEQEEGKTKKKRGRKKKEVNDMPEGQVPQDQLALFDENGNPIIVDVTDEIEPEFLVPGQKVFEAVAPHALKDTDQEAVSMQPGNKKFNVPDALKKLYYTVKRNIINLLDGNRGSEIDYPGVGRVYLRAQSRESLPSDSVLPSTAPVVLVAVDQYGNPITFDENGKVDPKGKIAVYNLRNPFDIEGTYEKMRIPAIARSMKITTEAAKEILLKERDLVERVIDYITKNPTNTIAMDIDGGSLGVIGNSPAPYFLSSVNFGTDPLEIDYAGGTYYFTLPGLHGQSIRLEQAAVNDRPELADMFADFMTQDIYLKGSLLDNLSKKAILEKYLMFNSGILAMLKAGPKVNGEVLDVSTPEAKAVAKEKIKEVFATLQPFGRPLSNAEVNEKVNGPDKAKVVKSAVGARRGDILVTKDLGTGEDVYRSLGYMTLNITSKGQQDNSFFKLTSRPDGSLSMDLIDGGYKNNYIKENFRIDKQLNAEGQLVSLNAYFTFLPLDSETSKLYADEIKEGQEKVDEWTRIQNEQAKKAKEEFDALPVETKQAIEILDQADIDMGSKPITYNLQVSKTFENRLRKGLYTREQANKIIDALLSGDIKNYVPFTHRGKYGLVDSIVTIMRKNVERYTRPTQPELTGGPTTAPVSNMEVKGVVKEGVLELFESNPELSKVGTPEQYSQYLETKDTPILYHGSPEYFEKFDPSRLGEYTGAASAKQGFFFGSSKDVSRSYLDKKGQTLNVDNYIKSKYGSIQQFQKEAIAYEFFSDNMYSYFAVLHDGTVLEDVEQYGYDNTEESIFSDRWKNVLDAENISLDEIKKSIDSNKVNDASLFKKYIARNNELKNTYDIDYGGYIDKDRSITDQPFEYLFIRPFTLNLKNPLIVSDEGKTYREETYYDRIVKAKEGGHDGLIIKDTFDSKFQTKPEDIYVVFDPNNIQELGSKEDIKEFKEFTSQLQGDKAVEMKDPLDTTDLPKSSAEEERSNKSREADANSNDLRKDDDDDPLGDRVTDEWTSRIISRSKGTITAEDIEVARAWYSKHPLSKHFPFEEAFDMVNEQDPGVIATWSMNGIVLYKGSDYTELYHEAFHGFTQAFMTPAQRKALYSEVRNMTGTFKDFEGKLTPFKLASDKQVEEYLAEEFRKYMISNGKMAIKSAPVRKSFFEKLINILEVLFGNLTIGEIMADSNANSEINKVFTALRKGDMSDYNFQKANVRFNSLGSSGINAIDEEDPFSTLSKKDSKLLLDTMDGLIAMFIDGANAAIKTEQGIADYLKFQIDMLTNNLSPSEMERQKVERTSIRDKEGNLKPVLTYSQSANILKTKEGRTKAYKRIEFALSSLEIALNDEYRKLKAKDANSNELQTIREKLGLVMFARQNFGDLTDIENNKADKDGIIRSVIGYHLAKSKDFGTKAIEMLDEDEEEAITRDGVRKEGNEISQKELATAEVKYLFKTIYKMDPKTRLPIVNELGSPVLMDMMEVFNKVATILENEIDVINMYNKLVKFAQQEKPTEMSMAVAQLINKLGPRGLDVNEFPHLNNRAVENLWTKFKNTMGLARIPLAAMTLERIKETGKLESRIGRGINPYASVGKGWNNEFGWNKENDFLTYDPTTGASYLNTKKVLDKYPDPDSLKTKGKYDFKKVFAFLNALGIKLSDTPEIRYALEFGSAELGTRGDFVIVRTLLSRNASRVVKDKLNKDQWGPKYDERVTTGYSLLEMIHKNGIKITRPEDIFKQYKMQVLAGKTTEIIGGEKVEKDLYMSRIDGERKNWLELQALEGQYGSGLPSFMVTTADGNTKFEMSLNSSMSIMVSAINNVQDDAESSAYQKLIELPYMAKFDLEQNPNAKRYVWLTNMFNIVDSNGELIPRSSEGWGKRKLGTGGIPIKLELYDISGIKSAEANGVSSASADPYTKFILDLHLATQRGLPELMRHSDKGTSYSVIPNYILSPDGSGDFNIGMYMANYKFAESREAFHKQAFDNYILPNLVSEHNRVTQFKAKKEEIDNILKQIKKEKKEGQQITPTPVFDFNYLAQGQKFLMFEGILNKSTKDKLSKVEGDLKAYFDNKDNAEAQELLQDVLQETQNYFEGQYREVKAKFDEYGFVATNHLESLAGILADKKIFINVETDSTRLENILLNSWVYNSWINNVESTNFLYGDIAQYNHAKEAFHKRNAGIASSGTGYRTDEDWLRFVNNTLGRKFEQQYTNRQMRTYDGTMNTGVMMDKITVSDYVNDLGFNLYNQMVDKAVRANEMSTSKKSRKDIERDIKIKLFGKSNAFVEIKSMDDIANIKLNKKDKAIMSAYYNMTEADAQGWISFDSYRILMDSQGEWTPAQEKLYMAMLNGQEISGDKLATFFPPIKAQYWGTLANSALDNPLLNGVSINAFHKFQLTPIIPTLAAVSPKLQKLHEKMMDEGIDYAVFESGSKIGTLTTVQFDKNGDAIRDEDGNIASIKDNIYSQDREITDAPFTKNVIHVEYLKNQVKIEPKWKHKVTFPSQIRKLIEVDLMENGVPTDFLVGEAIEDRIEKWFALPFEEQLATSKNFKDLIEYEDAVFELTQVKKAQLLKKAKLRVDENGDVVGNMANLVKYVKSQLSNQELADHELDFIDVDFDGNLKHDLSFSLAADKIERLLNALVIKALIRQKTSGESLIQVSGAMLEPATEEEIARYGGTNGLTYYTINKATNKINAMKVKIAIQGDFEKLLYMPGVAVFEDATDTEGNVKMHRGNPVKELNYNASLANLNRLIKDDNWLNQGDNRKMVTMHGDRIPIQGLNSDEVAEVFEFLPKEAGNIIILPAEIVAKSGGDFDIDKLTLLFPNIGMSSTMVDGMPEYTVGLYKKLDPEEYKKRYESYKEVFAKKYLTDGFESQRDKARALELHYMLNFDVEQDKDKGRLVKGKQDILSSVIELALEEGELMTLEEFILADQEKVAQNNVLFAINNLSTNIENYSNLVRPNGTDILDPIVDELKSMYRDYNPTISTNDEPNPSKGIQASKLFEITYNLHKQMTNNLGKKALGIGAVDNTYNELFNRIGLYLTPYNREMSMMEPADMKDVYKKAKEYYTLFPRYSELKEKSEAKKLKDSEKEEWEDIKPKYYKAKNEFEAVKTAFELYERQTLKLPHNQITVKDSQGNAYQEKAISLAHRYDANGEHKIGDVISQLMNGWVDIAADPWIFYLRGNDKLGPLLLFLVQAGVPIEHAAFFISQPIITEYMNEIDKLQSVATQASQSKDPNVQKITKDRAILKAKESILEKLLGVKVEGSISKNPSKNLSQIIKRESALLDNEDQMFDLDTLKSQLDYVNDNYRVYDENGRPIKESSIIDYTDSQISDFQKAVFIHFLQIADMERAVKDIKLRTNVDTGKSGTLFEAQDKIVKLKELKRTRQDDDAKGQTRYWRLPSEVIDRLVPTVKEKGVDTGRLDETKRTSPITSFYQQPFQLAIWKDLFPLRNNTQINRFLTDLSFTAKDDAKNSTYFTDDIELISQFKSSLLPIIFQNSFLTLDVTKLKNPTGPIYYRGSEVRLEKVEALPAWGAAYANGVMYYDYASLWDQFTKKTYLSETVSGVAPIISADTFTSFAEYVKFVFEREYLRADYVEDTYSKMEQLRKTDEEFNNVWKSSRDVISKDKFLKEGEEILRSESKKEYNRERLRYSFEVYLRNKALKNVYNFHALFNGETSFAYDIIRFKNQPYSKELMDKLPVLKYLIADNETSQQTKTERVNLAFTESINDKETIDSFYFQLQVLSNEVALQEFMPDLAADQDKLSAKEKKEYHARELYKIAETFRKLPIVAFLQSGMNTSGRFSLTRVVDNSIVEAMLLPQVKEFMDSLETGNPDTILRSMFNSFVDANSQYNARGKKYVIPVGNEGKPTNLFEDKMFIEERMGQKTYSPAFINGKGVVLKPYTRVDDKVQFKTFYGETPRTYDGVVTDIVWEEGKVAITVETKDDKGNPLQNRFFFSGDGKLVKYITPANNVNTGVNLEETIDAGNIVVRPDMLKEVPGYLEGAKTQPGDTIQFKQEFTNKDGAKVINVYDAEVLEVDDVGYGVKEIAEMPYGMYQYTSETPMYRIKFKYTKKDGTEVIVHNIVDVLGNVRAEIKTDGTLVSRDSLNQVYVNLRSDRIKADYVVDSLATANEMVVNGMIKAGSTIDIMEPYDTKELSKVRRSVLTVLDASDMTIKKLKDVYTGEEVDIKANFDIDSTKLFLAYNEAQNIGPSLAATGTSSAPVAKGAKLTIDIRDRYIAHSDFQNKAGIITRKKYRGGAAEEFFIDSVDPETGNPTVNPEAKELIDQSIDRLKRVRDDRGLSPVFSNAGYGQYMIGANDSTGKIITNEKGERIGIAVAPETFKYLSTRLLEEFGYINPNFVKEAEGVKEIARVTKQPITDEEYFDLMNKCFA